MARQGLRHDLLHSGQVGDIRHQVQDRATAARSHDGQGFGIAVHQHRHAALGQHF